MAKKLSHIFSEFETFWAIFQHCDYKAARWVMRPHLKSYICPTVTRERTPTVSITMWHVCLRRSWGRTFLLWPKLLCLRFFLCEELEGAWAPFSPILCALWGESKSLECLFQQSEAENIPARIWHHFSLAMLAARPSRNMLKCDCCIVFVVNLNRQCSQICNSHFKN